MSRFWEFAQLSDAFKDVSFFDKVPRAGELYIGGLAAFHKEPSPLRAAAITHIISVLDFNVKNELKLDEYRHVFIQVDDFTTENLLQHVEKTNQFIEDALHSKGAVFVHCAMGVSRSATIVCAYLMWKYALSAQGALEQLRQGRQRCLPNPGFAQQLRVYEKMLGAKSKADANKIYEKWSKSGAGEAEGLNAVQGTDSKL